MTLLLLLSVLLSSSLLYSWSSSCSVSSEVDQLIVVLSTVIAPTTCDILLSPLGHSHRLRPPIEPRAHRLLHSHASSLVVVINSTLLVAHRRPQQHINILGLHDTSTSILFGSVVVAVVFVLLSSSSKLQLE